MMKRLLLVSAIAMSVPFMAGAQTTASGTTIPTVPTVVLPDPGLVPGDFFYFLDRFGEGINSFFTFSPESKAHLALEHAQERASEVHAVLKEKGADAPEVKQVKQDFEEEMSLAATIVADEKAKGTDVSAFAEEIDNDFEMSKDMLKEAYRQYHNDLYDAEKGLRAKLNEATKAGDMGEIQAIQTALQGIADEQGTVKNEERNVDQGFDAEKQHLDEAMGDRQSAERHIANAERAYQTLAGEAQRGGLALDQTAVDSYKQFITTAKEAFVAGDFETAKEDAKEARNVLNDARQSLDMNDGEGDFFGGMNGGGEGLQEMMDVPGSRTQGERKEQEMGHSEQGGLHIRENMGEGKQGGQGMPAPDTRPDGQE